jgi:hypothetical protein
MSFLRDVVPAGHAGFPYARCGIRPIETRGQRGLPSRRFAGVVFAYPMMPRAVAAQPLQELPPTAVAVVAELPVLLWVFGAGAAAILLAWLGQMPGNRARRRVNPHATAIGLLGWLGLVLWPLWFLAMFWSRRPRVRRSPDRLSVAASCPPPSWPTSATHPTQSPAPPRAR